PLLRLRAPPDSQIPELDRGTARSTYVLSRQSPPDFQLELDRIDDSRRRRRPVHPPPRGLSRRALPQTFGRSQSQAQFLRLPPNRPRHPRNPAFPHKATRSHPFFTNFFVDSTN